MTCVYRISESCTLWPIHGNEWGKMQYNTSATTSNANPVCVPPFTVLLDKRLHSMRMCLSLFFLFFSFSFSFLHLFYIFNFVNYGIEINDKVHLHFIHLYFYGFPNVKGSRMRQIHAIVAVYGCCLFIHIEFTSDFLLRFP